MTLPVWTAEPDAVEPALAPPFLVEVAFKGHRRAFYRCDFDAPPPMGAAVVVEVDRGEDLGRVHATGDRAAQRSAGVPHGVGTSMPQLRILRLATPAEVTRERALRTEDEQARRAAAEKVRAANLDLKLSDAEWQFDRKKLTFYFTAEKRIDFRALVRDLAAQFRARIELKQYGVRDEAKRLSGIGRCGREYCSASWLPELRPVNLGVAKEQKLSLNPSQISGACGRLMCCLRYEHDFYAAARKRFPKEGKIIVTERGEEKIVSVDIFRDRVTLRSVEGEVRIAELAEITAASAVSATSATSAESIESTESTESAGTLNAQQDEDEADAANEGELKADAAPPRRGEPRPGRRDDARPARRSGKPEAPRADAPAESLGQPHRDPPPSTVVPSAASSNPSLDETGTDDDEGSDADDAPPSEGAARDTDGTTADGSATPRRRRRGRRGGRRGRGPGGAAGPGANDSPS